VAIRGAPSSGGASSVTRQVAPCANPNACDTWRNSPGLVAVKSGSGTFLSWRLFGTEVGSDIAFNVYKAGKAQFRADHRCHVLHGQQRGTGDYSVKAVVGGQEQTASPAEHVLAQNYIAIPLQNSSGYTGYVSTATWTRRAYELVVKEEKSRRTMLSRSKRLHETRGLHPRGKFMWRSKWA